jgi:hypothetical protein
VQWCAVLQGMAFSFLDIYALWHLTTKPLHPSLSSESSLLKISSHICFSLLYDILLNLLFPSCSQSSVWASSFELLIFKTCCGILSSFPLNSCKFYHILFLENLSSKILSLTFKVVGILAQTQLFMAGVLFTLNGHFCAHRYHVLYSAHFKPKRFI